MSNRLPLPLPPSQSSSPNPRTSHSIPLNLNHNQLAQPHHSSRKLSIAELLSSPPPLPVEFDQDEIQALSLSRSGSVLSRASLRASIPPVTDWSQIPLSDLSEPSKLISINASYSVQQAYEKLAKHKLTSVPVTLNPHSDISSCLSFDYSDLITYLLLVTGSISQADLECSNIDAKELSQHIAHAKRGELVPVTVIIKLHPKNPFVKFSDRDTLGDALGVLANGVHRLAITSPPLDEIQAILSQRRMLRYMWENARRFPAIEATFSQSIGELKIGLANPISIFHDQPLIEALLIMFHERVSSLAVVDRQNKLRGNISIVDVQHLTLTKNSHYLLKPVMTFVSYALFQSGLDQGQDQVPIFYVTNQTSLGRAVAKLVATRSHRLWIVERKRARAPSNASLASASLGETSDSAEEPPAPVDHGHSPIEGERLVGVLSITDILGLFASTKGRKADPGQARKQRRRSLASRSSIDSVDRATIFAQNKSGDVFRKSQ